MALSGSISRARTASAIAAASRKSRAWVGNSDPRLVSPTLWPARPIRCSDAASDVSPSLVEGVGQPIHQLVIIAMGMPIFDNLDLEAVAEEAARQNRWEFLLTAAPIAVGGGTGSPFNPIATF